MQFGTAKAGIYKQEDSIMGMTMTQKILAAAAGLSEVKAGQLIEADLSLVLGNDITSPVAIHEMERFDKKGVFDKDKIALVLDHFVPNKDIKSAEHCKCVREFAGCNEITNFFDVGEMGIEHALLPEKGLVVAGDVVIGADSHTCTYGALGAFSTGVGSTDMAAGMATGKAWFKVPSAIKFVLTGKPAEYVTGKDVILHIIGMIGVDGALYQSMEFTGDGISYLSMDDRLCIANMAIEAGGKNGIFPDGLLHLLPGHIPPEAAVNAGIRLTLQDIPHLIFTVFIFLFQRIGIIRMHLHGQVLPGVNELDQKRKPLQRLAFPAPALFADAIQVF